jgi:hypothetical protein
MVSTQQVTTTEPAQDVETAVEVMMSSSDRLLAASGDAPEMVRQARILGQATAQLIQAIKVNLGFILWGKNCLMVKKFRHL